MSYSFLHLHVPTLRFVRLVRQSARPSPEGDKTRARLLARAGKNIRNVRLEILYFYSLIRNVALMPTRSAWDGCAEALIRPSAIAIWPAGSGAARGV